MSSMIQDSVVTGAGIGLTAGATLAIINLIEDKIKDRRERDRRSGLSDKTIMLTLPNKEAQDKRGLTTGNDALDIIASGVGLLGAGYGTFSGVRYLANQLRGADLKSRRDAARKRYETALGELIKEGHYKEANDGPGFWSTLIGGAGLTWTLPTLAIGYFTKRYLDSKAKEEDKEKSLGEMPFEPRVRIKYAGVDIDIADIRTMAALTAISKGPYNNWDPGLLAHSDVKEAMSKDNLTIDKLVKQASECNFSDILGTNTWGTIKSRFSNLDDDMGSYIDKIWG